MNALDTARLEAALKLLGETLAFRARSAQIAVIGGSALLLRGAVERTTHDVDVLALVDGEHLSTAKPLPEQLRLAVLDVARVMDLSPDWMNAEPTALLDLGLPTGFLERCEVRRYDALVIHIASRRDLIHFKLYAAADHGPASKHVADLRALGPERSEFLDAARWCRTQDPSPAFLESLRKALEFFGVEVLDDEI